MDEQQSTGQSLRSCMRMTACLLQSLQARTYVVYEVSLKGHANVRIGNCEARSCTSNVPEQAPLSTCKRVRVCWKAKFVQHLLLSMLPHTNLSAGRQAGILQASMHHCMGAGLSAGLDRR